MYNTIIEFLKNIATNDFNHKNTATAVLQITLIMLLKVDVEVEPVKLNIRRNGVVVDVVKERVI